MQIKSENPAVPVMILKGNMKAVALCDEYLVLLCSLNCDFTTARISTKGSNEEKKYQKCRVQC